MNKELLLLRELYARGFDHLSAIAQSLKKIQDNAKDEKEAAEQSVALSMIFRAINDIIHPGFEQVQELFPEKDLSEFIAGLRKAQKDAVDKKIFPPCQCSECRKTDGVTNKLLDKYDTVLKNLSDK